MQSKGGSIASFVATTRRTLIPKRVRKISAMSVSPTPLLSEAALQEHNGEWLGTLGLGTHCAGTLRFKEIATSISVTRAFGMWSL